jgi:predicted acylesterase/phospholipase RssA
MTREDIVRMARKAGSLIETAQEKDLIWLEDFAKLVAQHTLSNIDPSKFMSYQEGMEAGRLAEREACAKVCDEEANKHPIGLDSWWAVTHCAQAIQARGQA